MVPIGRRTATCENCHETFTLNKNRGRRPRRCTTCAAQKSEQAVQEDAVPGIHDAWVRHLAGELHQLGGRLMEEASPGMTSPDPTAILHLAARLRQLNDDITAAAILRARDRRGPVGWGVIGQIFGVTSKTATTRWDPEKAKRQLYRRFGNPTPTAQNPTPPPPTARVPRRPAAPPAAPVASTPRSNSVTEYLIRVLPDALTDRWPPGTSAVPTPPLLGNTFIPGPRTTDPQPRQTYLPPPKTPPSANTDTRWPPRP